MMLIKNTLPKKVFFPRKIVSDLNSERKHELILKKFY